MVNKEVEIKKKNLGRKLETMKKANRNSQESGTNTTFYPRVVNNSTVKFATHEITLLEKGLKYNLHWKPKNWIERTALEAETAISYIDVTKQDYIRHTVTEHLATIQRNFLTNSNHRERDKHEWRTMKEIKEKIRIHNLIVTRADKGRTVVIMEKASTT
jgi:hypothetical protein